MRAPLFALLLCPLVAMPCLAADVDRRLDGCEAEDMARLLGASGKSAWQGSPRALGDWIFASRVAVSCAGGRCEVGSGLDARHGTLGAIEADRAAAAFYGAGPHGHMALRGLEPVLAPAPNTGQSLRSIQGEAARDLIAAMLPHAFDGSDGRKHLVWMDYGDIRGISIRARTALACSRRDELCHVQSGILVYVPDRDGDEGGC